MSDRSRAISLTILLCFLASVASASQAYTVARTEARVLWDLTLVSDGTTISLTVRDGEMARVTTPDGEVLGITASIDDQTRSSVLFRIFQIVEVPDAGEMLRQVEKFLLHPDAEYLTAATPKTRFKLKEVMLKPDEAASGEDAYTVKASDALIAWEIRQTFPGSADHSLVKFVARDGELTRLRDPAGRTLGFTPTLEADGAVGFRVFEITRPIDNEEALRQVEKFTLRTGTEHAAKVKPGLVVRLTEIRRKS